MSNPVKTEVATKATDAISKLAPKFDYHALLQKAAEAAQSAAGWAKVQATDLVHQFLLWSAASDAFVIVLALIVMVALHFVFTRNMFYKKARELQKSGEYGHDSYSFNWDRGDCGVLVGLFLALNVISIFVNFIIIACHIYDLVELWIAPKLYLLEWAAQFVQNHSH